MIFSNRRKARKELIGSKSRYFFYIKETLQLIKLIKIFKYNSGVGQIIMSMIPRDKIHLQKKKTIRRYGGGSVGLAQIIDL